MRFVYLRRPEKKPKAQALSEVETDGLPANFSFAWYEGFGLLYSIASYILDTFLDAGVAWNHYDDNEMWYFGLTVAFVVITSLVMMFFSMRWYIADSKEPYAPKVSSREWAMRIILLLFQLGPVLRYADSLRYGVMYWKEKDRDPRKAKLYFKRMTYEDADAGILRLLEAFMEAAPQLLLQIYIMAQPDYDQGTDTMWFQFGSCITSLLSLSWALASQQRSQRFSQAKLKNPSWPATIVQYCWYLLVTYSRVLCLGLFVSLYPRTLAVVCASRFVVMALWLQTMKSTFCDTTLEEVLYKCVLGVVFLFCYVNPENSPTRWRYFFYYLYTFTEDAVLIALWYVNVGPHAWYKLLAIITVFVSFAVGITFMVVYYLYFHPSGKIQVYGWHPLRSIGTSKVEDREMQNLEAPPANGFTIPHDVETSSTQKEDNEDFNETVTETAATNVSAI